MLCDLATIVPPEIGVHIFKQLLPLDSRLLLEKVQIHLHNTTQTNLQLDSKTDSEFRSLVIGWLYARIYGNTLVIYSDSIDAGCLGSLEYDFATTPSHFMNLQNDPMFLANIPRKLGFRLARGVREHTHFQNSLVDFVQMVSSKWAHQYFEQISEISFALNGESSQEASPTLLLVGALNVLANLTKLRHCNINSLEITKTHIGEMFPHKWEGVFSHFPSVKHLSLRDNHILQASANHSEIEAGMNTKWPADLRSLCLAGNEIAAVSAAYLSQLPTSLERLDFSKNNLESFGTQADDSFTLVSVLPNLKELDLSNNKYLIYVDPRIFRGPRAAGTRLKVFLNGSKIMPECLQAMKEQARLGKFVLFV